MSDLISQEYEDAGNGLRDKFLVWLQEDPNNESIMRADLYDAYTHLKEQGKITGEEGFTGFIVGWAASDALHKLGKDGVPNPAIMYIEIPDVGIRSTIKRLFRRR